MPIFLKTAKNTTLQMSRIFDHDQDNSWLKKVQSLAVDGHSGRNRPCKTWEHVIMEDLRVKGLRRGVAQNRAGWRSATT